MKPVYVSIGHKISLAQAIRLTLACGKGYRIPEPTRQADLLAGQAKRSSSIYEPGDALSLHGKASILPL